MYFLFILSNIIFFHRAYNEIKNDPTIGTVLTWVPVFGMTSSTLCSWTVEDWSNPPDYLGTLMLCKIFPWSVLFVIGGIIIFKFPKISTFRLD